MPTESLVLAIDGGGTSTTACVAGRAVGSQESRVLGKATADQSNPAVVGLDRCRSNVLESANKAIASAQLNDSRQLHRLVIGLAGIEATNFHQELEQAVATQLGVDSVHVMTDIELLLLASNGERPTFGIISGTGSVAVGRTLDGHTARSGGRGFLTGDAGSGFWIGQQGFTAAIGALDRIAPITKLVEAISAQIGSRDAAVWTNFVYTGERDARSIVASFAPLVFEEAEHGDPVAREIVNRAGLKLATLVQGVADQLGLEGPEYDAVLAGGVLVHREALRRTMNDHLLRIKLAPTTTLVVEDPAVAVALSLARCT